MENFSIPKQTSISQKELNERYDHWSVESVDDITDADGTIRNHEGNHQNEAGSEDFWEMNASDQMPMLQPPQQNQEEKQRSIEEAQRNVLNAIHNEDANSKSIDFL